VTTLRSLARALGGEVSGDHVLAPGPRHSKHDRSMAVWIDPSSPSLVRVHSFAGDDWRDCLKHTESLRGIDARETFRSARSQLRGSKHPTAENSTIARPRAANEDHRSERALDIFKQSVDAHGSPVEAYLKSRRLRLPRGAHVLRYHAACPFRLENGKSIRLPTMVALFRNIISDKPVAIHRTALKPDGSGKAEVTGLGNPKKMLGPTRGAVIKLDRDADVSLGVGIAEGIETGLTIFGAHWSPIWACGAAGAISTFPVLSGIDELTIFGDADPAGITAARTCQARWAQADKLCTILLPQTDGNDWNDLARAA
jgi:putative DNA primase/helicase